MINQSENLLAKNFKKNKYFLLLFLLIGLSVLIPIFDKSKLFFKGKSLVLEDKPDKISLLGLLINQLDMKDELEMHGDPQLDSTTSTKLAVLDDQTEVKVLPIVISENITAETEEIATQFAMLKSKCPIYKDTFNLDFSYENDKFEAFVVTDKENEFWQWLATNYPKLKATSFTVIKL